MRFLIRNSTFIILNSRNPAHVPAVNKVLDQTKILEEPTHITNSYHNPKIIITGSVGSNDQRSPKNGLAQVAYFQRLTF